MIIIIYFCFLILITVFYLIPPLHYSFPFLFILFISIILSVTIYNLIILNSNSFLFFSFLNVLVETEKQLKYIHKIIKHNDRYN